MPALLGLAVLLPFVRPQPLLAQAGPSGAMATDSAVVVGKPADSALPGQDSTHAEDVHPQDSQVDRGFLIAKPDRQATLRIFGSVRLHGGYDLNGLQSSDYFDTYAIPTGSANKAEPRFFMDMNETRLGIESRNETSVGDLLMHIEGDFRSSTKTLRLIHAYGMVMRFMAGLTWSTFGDPSSIPATVDVIGPNSSVGERAIQGRFTRELRNKLKFAFAIETPTPEITQPESVVTEPSFQNIPNLAARIKKSGEWGHLQLAGVLRGLTAKTVANGSQKLPGYGGLVSGRAVLNERQDLLFQVVGGQAIARYIAALAGTGQDVFYDATTDQFATVPVVAWQLAFGHRWRPHLQSFATAGGVGIHTRDFQPADALKRTDYASANLMWNRISGLRAGLEYSWGRRVNKDGGNGTANRISFSIYYDY
jgi:hypothetical protein